MDTDYKGAPVAPTLLFKSNRDGGLIDIYNELGAKIKDPDFGDLFRKKVTGRQRPVKVAILGGGVAGLTLAYELLLSNKNNGTNYKVTLLEANKKVGGRSLTLRKGDSFTEVMENGKKFTQKCDFIPEDPQPYEPYLNAGPGRIPSGHRNVLNYCQELGVKMETYIMESRSNRLYPGKLPGYKPQPHIDEQVYINRRLANDTRGRLAELMFHQADRLTNLDPDEVAALKELLIVFGALDKDAGVYQGVYRGSSRSGYLVQPGGKNAGVLLPPMRMSELLESGFWRMSFYQPDDWLWQASSFQPIGGMDQIEVAFKNKIEEMAPGTIQTEAMVNRVRRTGGEGKRFEVTWNKTTVGQFDYCISNIPLPLTQSIIDLTGFELSYKQSLEAVYAAKGFFRPTCKVGWQAERRLWQNPENANVVPIFGGISYTADEMTQMWYPSDNFHGKYGVLTGAYNYNDNAIFWGQLDPKDRLDRARKQAANLHGEEFAAGLQKGLTIAWQNIPTQKGGWNDWSFVAGEDRQRVNAYNRLLTGDDGFFVIGDQISHLHGWKEGAIISALNVLAQVTEVKNYNTQTYEIAKVPDTKALVEGYLF